MTDLIAGNIHIVHLGQIIFEDAPFNPDPLLGLQPSLLLHHPDSNKNNNNQQHSKNEENWKAVFRIHVFFDLPDPDPLVRGMDPDPDPYPSIIMQK